MANTTNFNWETPDDTDLVKDGAAAIRTLGSSIDTSFVDLKGGTTGQILSKASNTDLDYTWIANDQGDITEVSAGTGISVASGTGPVPVVTNTVATTFDAKGDLVVGTGADTFAKLAVGTNGHTLVADSSTATGLAYAAPSTGGLVKIAETSFSAVSTGSFTGCFSSSYGSYLIVIKEATGSTGGANLRFRLRTGGSDVTTNYNGRSIEFNSVYTSYANTTSLFSIYVDSSTPSGGYAYVHNPFNAVDTTYQMSFANTLTTTQYIAAGGNTNDTSYADLGLSADSGTFTAKVAIYGLS